MIVSILSPKGGCGKSTTTMTLASVFSNNEDLSVAIVDADPRQSIARVWLGKRKEEELGDAPFKVISDPSDSSILDTLEAAGDEHDLVFVDLEGVAGLLPPTLLQRPTCVSCRCGPVRWMVMQRVRP